MRDKQSATPDSEKFAKNREKEGKIRKNRKKMKIGKKRQKKKKKNQNKTKQNKKQNKREGSFTLSLLTDRAGYATDHFDAQLMVSLRVIDSRVLRMAIQFEY